MAMEKKPLVIALISLVSIGVLALLLIFGSGMFAGKAIFDGTTPNTVGLTFDDTIYPAKEFNITVSANFGSKEVALYSFALNEKTSDIIHCLPPKPIISSADKAKGCTEEDYVFAPSIGPGKTPLAHIAYILPPCSPLTGKVDIVNLSCAIKSTNLPQKFDIKLDSFLTLNLKDDLPIIMTLDSKKEITIGTSCSPTQCLSNGNCFADKEIDTSNLNKICEAGTWKECKHEGFTSGNALCSNDGTKYVWLKPTITPQFVDYKAENGEFIFDGSKWETCDKDNLESMALSKKYICAKTKDQPKNVYEWLDSTFSPVTINGKTFKFVNGEWQEQSSSTCTDSDDGKDYDNKGTVTLVTAGLTSSKTDSCDSQGKIVEYFCTAENANQISQETHTCPNGCKDGACGNLQQQRDKNIQNILDEIKKELNKFPLGKDPTTLELQSAIAKALKSVLGLK